LWLFLASIFIPIATIVMELLFQVSSGVTQSTIVTSIVIIFFINVVVFFLYDSLVAAYDKQLNSAIAEQERTYYYNQCLLMQASAEDVRSFKHDMNNHLSLLQKFMDDGKNKEAQAYINELVQEHQQLKKLYSATGNVAIDSILNYKLGSISNPNLHIDVQANVPTELAVEIVDLSIILTNLLDNALTAITKTIGECQLSIRISYQKGMLLIRVSNSYNGDVQYENGELVTTKAEKHEHGRGLQNVRKAAEKYQGALRLKHDASTFTAEVILYAP
jgi:sensor histidine kinase regulating citrate/malate metabolism